MSQYYLGLLSGTSMDAIDAAIVDFSTQAPTLVATHSNPFPKDLFDELRLLCCPGHDEINRLGQMNRKLGELFAKTALLAIKQSSLNIQEITAIGSHGQTIRHSPNATWPFTLQISDPSTIAAITGITTVANFRAKDIALGGQGAPLTPAFHNYLFRSNNTDRTVVNLGGIANLTYLPKNQKQAIQGFDTGPCNILLDAWTRLHTQQSFDNQGTWAQSGKVIDTLLNTLLNDDYFSNAPPKSTGPEYFNLEWLNTFLTGDEKTPDVQRTLTELTAISIAQEILKLNTQCEVILCGGGAENHFLVECIKQHLAHCNIITADELGISAKWLEAMAFAWFAKQTLNKQTSNTHHITGASRAGILGGVYYP